MHDAPVHAIRKNDVDDMTEDSVRMVGGVIRIRRARRNRNHPMHARGYGRTIASERVAAYFRR